MNAANVEPIDIGDAVELEQAEFERQQAAAEAAFDGEPEPGPEPQPEPSPEPEPEPASDQAAEAAMAEIDKLGERYTKAVAKVQGRTPLGLVECPVCPVPGYVPDAPGLGLPPEQLELVLAILNSGAEEGRPQHPQLERCDTCDGWGLLPTGSRRDSFIERPCPKCGGNGYLDAAVEQALADSRPPEPGALALVPPVAPGVYAPPPAAGQVQQGGHSFYLVPGGSADPYGRLPGHPLWGHDPSEGGY